MDKPRKMSGATVQKQVQNDY